MQHFTELFTDNLSCEAGRTAVTLFYRRGTKEGKRSVLILKAITWQIKVMMVVAEEKGRMQETILRKN